MQAVHTTSHVGNDGVLSLVLTMPPELANKDVEITVRAAKEPFATREEWVKFVREMAGSWEGEFHRPDQGQYEVRDSFE